MHSVRATAAAASGHVREAIASLGVALELADSTGTGTLPETLTAVVAVFALSDKPLIAARAWGAAIAGDEPAYGEEAADRALGERMVAPARLAIDPIAYELAVEDGRMAERPTMVKDLIAELLDISEGLTDAGQKHHLQLNGPTP